MAIDKIELRNALGSFATGITVITSKAPSDEAIGMTVNSFASLSLDPPLVLWSLQNNSECAPIFSQVSHYNVSVLSTDQQDLSNRYAKKGSHGLDKADYQEGEASGVVIKNAIASFECKIEHRLEGGDHTIMVGRVLAFNTATDGEPLLFHSGKYRTLA